MKQDGGMDLVLTLNFRFFMQSKASVKILSFVEKINNSGQIWMPSFQNCQILSKKVENWHF